MVETEKKIMELRNQSQALYRSGKYQEAINKLKEAWDQLPQPKEEATFSNVLAGEIGESYLEDVQNYEEALHWGDILISCHANKVDSGEGEFLKGRVYYELNERENAKEQFAIAMKKSEGTAFEGADKKYINLLKS